MSDQEDQDLSVLVARITAVYEALRTVCAFLPIPIELPIHPVGGGDITEPVCRVIEVSDEIPMPEHQQAQLCTGALHWVAAVDLAAVGANTPGDYRYLAAHMNLSYGEQALIGLMDWMQEQE
jgi:hypothetical protein